MASRKSGGGGGGGAYGAAAASDTDFRKTWDAEEYAAKAKVKDDERREEARLRYEAKLEGKKYHKYVDPATLESTSARGSRLDVASMVGKTVLVPAGSSGVGKRGRGAGFYCDVCDLTYKDNVQFVEHLNSKQHLVNTGQSGEVKRATLEEVKDMIDLLMERKRRKEEEDARLGVVDIGERIKKAEELDEREREEKRAARRERRKKKGGNDEVKMEDDSWEERLGVIS